MKALVTGANGFTGSHLVQALERRGDQVVGLVRQSSNLEPLAENNLKLVYGDITNGDVLQTAMAGVDTVFHVAAYVDLGIVNAEEMFRVNVEGTRTVLEVARAVGIKKLVYCSTIGIYGDSKGKVVNETYQRQQKDFSSAYDRSKYQGQKLVDQSAQKGLPVVSLMPSGIFGSDDPHFGPVLKLFVANKLKLWVGGDRLTGIVHVDDLVEAMLLAAEKAPPGEHYIISAGELATKEMFAILSQATGIPTPKEVPQSLARLVGKLLDPLGRWFKFNPPLSKERLHYVYDRCVRVDSSKAQQELAWQPRSPEEVLRQIVRELEK
ncbi:MAG: NAD-dependent epimerase/dehydratase family protein [Spirulinaceae cyanobacterium]